MAVTDLTSTTWVLNDNIDIPTSSASSFSYSIDFVSNNNSYSSIRSGSRNYGTLYYGSTIVYSTYEWSDTAYKTISITGGTDATNASAIAWLEANGKQQVASYPKINSFTYYGKQINHINGKPIRYVHYKGNTYEYQPILTKLATPQNVSADGTTITFDAVENATSYEILADGASIGTVENKTGYSLTITNNTGVTISTRHIRTSNISSISPIEDIANGETKTFLLTFTEEFSDTYIYFEGFAYYVDTGSTFSGDGIASLNEVFAGVPVINFTKPVVFNGSGYVIFNGYDD